MQTIYGVLDSNDCHIDISTSLKCTKRAATNQGYKFVSARYNGGCNAQILFEKVGKNWKPFNN